MSAEVLPPEGSPSPSVREILARLGRLRGRIRAVFAAMGVARWLVGLVLALAVFFLADRLLDLPLGVRRFVRLGLLDRPQGLDVPLWVFLLLACLLLAFLLTRVGRPAAPLFAFLAAGVGGLLVWLAVRLFLPLSVRLPDQDLALSVERRFRHLNDRLAAALDFEQEIRDPSRGESVPMMQSVVAQAVKESEGLEFTHVVSARRALSWGLGATGALGVAALAIALMPGTLSLWMKRSLLLRDEPWPRATTVEAVDVPPTPGGPVALHDPAVPFRASVGHALTVTARVKGDVPDLVYLVDLLDSGRPLRRKMFPVPDHAGLFSVEVRDLRRPFQFVLKAGDDVDDAPLYSVEVTVPPQVLDLRAALEFPVYLDRPPETREGGNVTVPEGTRVTVSFTPDAPPASVRAFVGEVEQPAQQVEGTPGRYEVSFVPEKSLRYRIAVATADGRENDPARDSYEVEVEPDRPPQLEWVFPRGPVEVTPNGRVPLLALTTDDHGVTDLRLEVRLSGDEVLSFALTDRKAAPPPDAPDATPPTTTPPTTTPQSLAANDGPYSRASVRTYVPLDIATLKDAKGVPPGPSSRMAVRLVGRDSKGQSREGTWTPIDVYRPADLERTLAGRRSGLRTEYAAILAEQVERRRQTAETTKGPLGDAEKDLLKTIQFAQAKIAQDTDRTTRSLLALFTDFVYDRLGNEGPNERVLAILDRWHRRTYGAPEPSAAMADGGESAEAVGPSGDPVFPYALFEEVVQAWREKAIFDTAILDRMLAVLSPALDAAVRLAPAAHRGAVAAASGGAKEIEVSLAAEDALSTALQAVLDSMKSWQNLNDVVLQWRRLVEEQTALNERMKAPQTPGNR